MGGCASLPSCLLLSDLTAMATHTATATRTAASPHTAAMPGFTDQGMDMATHTPACTAATHLVLDTDTRTADTRTAQDMDMAIHILAMDTADMAMAVTMVVMDTDFHTISASKSSKEVVLDGVLHGYGYCPCGSYCRGCGYIHSSSASKSSQEVVLDGIFHAD